MEILNFYKTLKESSYIIYQVYSSIILYDFFNFN